MASPEECDYQTEVESLTDTSLHNSSVTLFPASSSETDFSVDACLHELIESQFSSEEKVKEEKASETVQQWVDNSEDQNSNQEDQYEGYFDHTPPEKIQKMAAALTDGIKTDLFHPAAWLEEEDHTVPDGDFVSNFMQDAQERLPVALMNVLKMVFTSPPCTTMSAASTNGFRYVFAEILYCAAEMVKVGGGYPSRSAFLDSADFSKLAEYRNGEYFSPWNLRIKKLPRQKVPIVRAVKEAVNESINRAFDAKSPMLFTAYGLIPRLVQTCNDKRGLGYNPEQIARYAIRLQEAVHQDMVGRCLDFLAFCGFKLKDVYWEDEREYLSSNDACLNESLSLSQATQEDDVESMQSSQGSSLQSNQSNEADETSEGLGLPEIPPNSIDLALNDLENSPGFREYLRGNIEGNNSSPEGSWNSQVSLSPPQYSLPEVGPSQPSTNDLIDEDGWVAVQPADYTNVLLEFPSLSQESVGSHNSFEEGPQRRRRRLN